MAKKYADSPVAFVGVASPASASSASTVPTRHGVTFPNAVDLGGLTYALYDVPARRSHAFLIDEEGKIVLGYDLAYITRGAGPMASAFAAHAKPLLEGARDPFGIDEVPRQGKRAYEALKYGQFGMAGAYANQLKRSKDASLKEFADKVIGAVKAHAKSRLEMMAALAKEGKAGELQAEIEAFMAAFPRAKKSELARLAAKANRKGRNEALAAVNFKNTITLLTKGSSTTNDQARALCRALVARFGDTHYGKLAQTLLANWPAM